MGLPGSGKTTLAKELSKLINAVHWNADDVRQNINKDLGFSTEDRIEQARRMGFLCDNVYKIGYPVIADFVCPLLDCRKAFGPSYIFFMDTIKESRYSDTNHIFQKPTIDEYNLKFMSFDAVGNAKIIVNYLKGFSDVR